MAKQQKLEEQNLSKLNEVLIVETIRPDGSRRIQQDFSNCPTLAEQHTAHLTDINYLIERYKPDELQAYINARNQYRAEIIGHDFSIEPDLTEGRNIVLRSRKEFEALPDDVKYQFRNHLEFLKFIDNPQNVEKMLKLGILTKRQVENIQIPDPNSNLQDEVQNIKNQQSQNKNQNQNPNPQSKT